MLSKKAFIFAAAAMSSLAALPLSADSFDYFESDITESHYYSKDVDIDKTSVRPYLTVTVDGTENGKVFNASEIAGRTVNCTVMMNNADLMYDSACFRIHYDNRLSLEPFSSSELAKPREALNDIEYKRVISDPFYSADNHMSGFFTLAVGNGDNSGRNGAMWEFQLKMPEKVREGTVYPIDINYRVGDETEDEFWNKDMDVNSNFYFFANGIHNLRYNCTFKANEQDIELCPSLKKLAGYYDGYIAIAGGSQGSSNLSGDTNLDGEVTIADAVAILQHLGNMDKYPLSAEAKLNSDVYDKGDGITGNDALTIQKVDAGLIDAGDLPLEK